MIDAVTQQSKSGTNGARFWNVDLHVHTPASSDVDAGAYGATTPEEVVQAAMDAGLAAIAVTDHNTVAWCDRVTEAAAGHDLVVLPGVEISTNEGHLLGIWDEGTSADEIETVLSRLGFSRNQLGTTEACAQFGFAKAAECIQDSDGLAIPAHVDKEKGLLGLPVASHVHQTLLNPAIAAVEVTDPGAAAAVQNKIGGRRRLACVRGSDAPTPGRCGGHAVTGIGARSTWIKAARPDLRGLQHAFDDPELRVRLEPPPEPTHPTIRSVAVSGGFFDGQSFDFSGDLNCLLGGTGTGKSLLVEIIRFALGQQASIQDFPQIRDEVNSRLECALGINATVRIDLLVGGSEFTVSRVFSGEQSPTPEVEIVSGDAASLAEGRIPIRAFSQGEIIEYAREPVGRMSLIDAQLDLGDLDEQEREAIAELAANSDTVVDCRRQIEQVETDLERLPELEEKLAELSGIFDSGLIQDQQRWSRETVRLGDLAERDDLTTPPKLPKATGLDTTVINEDNTDLYERVETVVTELNSVIEQINDQIAAAYGKAKKELGGISAEWHDRNRQFQSLLAAKLQQIDGGRQGLPALQRHLQELQTRKAKLDDAAQRLYQQLHPELQHLLEQREQILREITAMRKERRSRRKERIRHLNALMHGEVRIKLAAQAEDKEFGTELSRLGKGSNLKAATYERLRTESDPTLLVRSYLANDPEAVAKATGVPLKDIDKLFDTIRHKGREADFLELQGVELQDHLQVEFRHSGTGRYQPIEQLAHGQKCTAILIIAMADGTEPLVLDQPEDALHAPWIEEHLVDRLRILRGTRQYILATRSSGLVVSADAEMIITLKADAEHGFVEASGSLERLDLNKLALYHLEGGREPFKRRRDKLAISV